MTAHVMKKHSLVSTAMIVLVALATPCLAFAEISALDRSAWTNYTNINTILDLATRGDTVWMATTGGLAYFVDNDPQTVTRLTNKEGLGHNDCRFVAFGPEGAVWTGGPEGRLSRRWSDIGWSVYPFSDEGAGIPLNHAAGGPNGFLWVGSDAGLHKFDIDRNGGEIKETYTRIGVWTGSSISHLYIANGRIWVGGASGAAYADISDEFLLDPSRWTSWFSPPNVHAITMHDGFIVAGAASGLWRYGGDPPGGSGTWTPVGFTDRSVRDLISHGDTLWVATDRGLGFVVGAKVVNPPALNSGASAITSLAITESGTLWFARASGGLFRLTAQGIDTVFFDGPVDNDIVDMAVADDGRVWCVHPTRGLDILEPDFDEWTALPFTDSLVSASGPATGVDIAGDGDVWVSMWGSGGMQIDPDNPFGNHTRYDTSNSALMFVTDPGGPNNYIVTRDVKVDDRGRVWFANAFADSGVRIVYNDHGCWGRYGSRDGITSTAVQALATLADRILIGFGNIGIGEFVYREPLCTGGVPSGQGGTLTVRNTFDGLPTDEVFSVLIDRADTLWVGTSAGLVRWIPDLRGFFSVALPSDAGLSINALAADAFNTIWIGTGRGLVARHSNGDTEFFTPFNSPLVGREVHGLTVDDRRGEVWVGTRSGMSRIVTGAAPVESVDEVLALPNPFEISSGESREVRFNAPFGSHIYIYTVAGDPVIDFDASQGWDGRNRNRALVASGVYLFVVRGPDGDYGRGKLAVIQTN